jgi:hypothetical protein
MMLGTTARQQSRSDAMSDAAEQRFDATRTDISIQ